MQAMQHVNIILVCVGMLSPWYCAQKALALAEIQNLAGAPCLSGSPRWNTQSPMSQSNPDAMAGVGSEQATDQNDAYNIHDA